MRKPLFCLLIVCLTCTSVMAVETISIAYFNCLRFGAGGCLCKDIELLANILERFDVIALGEVKRNTGVDACGYGDDPLGHVDALVGALNAHYPNWCNPHWDYVVSSEPIGRTPQSEEYGVVIHRDWVTGLRDEVEVAPDPEGAFIRPPFVVPLRANSFDFTLVIVHAIGPESADDLETSIRQLDTVYEWIRFGNSGDDDVILLGDFNVSASREGWFDELRAVDGMECLISGNGTLGQTGLANPYDRIWINTLYTGYEHDMFCGSGVYRYWSPMFPGMPYEEFLATYRHTISDHLPVWAEFRIDLPDDD